MRIISVANQKGGCGKTTVTVNLAAALSDAGLRVLVVDNDPQGHSTLGFGVRAKDFSLSTRDLYLASDVAVEEIALELSDHLDLVPSDVDLSTVEVDLAADPHRLDRLGEGFSRSEMAYDVVLVDNPPNVGVLTFSAMLASAELLVPVDAGRFTLEAVERLQETVELLRHERGHRLRIHLVANGFDLRTRFCRELLERLAMTYPGALLDTRVHRTVRVAESADLGMPVVRHDARSRASADFRALAEELWTLRADLVGAGLDEWEELLHGPRVDARGVRFEVAFPSAREVAITGDFTGWSVEGLPLERGPHGTWILDLRLEPGFFEYKYIVDGVWKTDPDNPERVRNSYGQLNSVLSVGAAS